MRQSAGAEVADPPNGPRWRSLIWLSFVILAAIEFAISVRWLARQPMTDLPIFLNATRRFADGGQLYESAGDTEHYAPVAAVFKYPPLYALLLRPFVELRMAVALRALFWVHVVIYVATIAGWLALAGAARRGAPLAAVAGGTIAALSFGPAFESLRGAQLELPILALLALATAAWSTRRDIVLGAALGTAAALKVYPILLLLALLAARRWRAVASFVVTIALLALVCLVAFGTAECRAWLFGVLPLMLREPPTNLLENTSLSRQLMSLGIAPEAAKRIGQAVALPLIAAGCWLAAVAARSGPRAEKLVIPLFATLVLVAMPNAWMNYQLLLLPAIILLIAEAARGGPWRRVTTIAVISSCMLVAVTGDNPLALSVPADHLETYRRIVDLRFIATFAIALTLLTVTRALRQAAAAASGTAPSPA